MPLLSLRMECTASQNLGLSSWPQSCRSPLLSELPEEELDSQHCLPPQGQARAFTHTGLSARCSLWLASTALLSGTCPKGSEKHQATGVALQVAPSGPVNSPHGISPLSLPASLERFHGGRAHPVGGEVRAASGPLGLLQSRAVGHGHFHSRKSQIHRPHENQT